MGSLAASQYASRLEPVAATLPPIAQERAQASLAGALQTAAQLPGEAGRLLQDAANAGFLDGLHLSVTVGALLCLTSSLLVLRFLPHQLDHSAGHGAADSIEGGTLDEDLQHIGAAEAIEDVVIVAG